MVPQGPSQPRPMQGPQQPLAPPQGSTSPDLATRLAVQQGLQGRGPPSAYGMLANRAALSPLMGPGGPPMPQPAQPGGLPPPRPGG